MNTPTISIDLGASYTKVAYRKPLTRGGRGQLFATANTAVGFLEGQATIPSVMIHTQGRKQTWIAGRDAANTKPNNKMKVFENWKAALYSNDFDGSKDELFGVVGSFFKWLYEMLGSIGVDFENECRVRVAIPKLKHHPEEQNELLKRCMCMNGWPGPESIELVHEPVANLIGVLSAGRNVVSASGKISYQRTFGDAEGKGVSQLDYIFNEIRKYFLGARSKRHMQVRIFDFGSFTLDVAGMRLDMKVTECDSFPVESVDAQSWEVGVIEDIDRPCFRQLFVRHNMDGAALAFEVKESLKMALYAGEAYAVSFGRGRAVFGDTVEDKRIVEEAIAEYCHKAWLKISEYCQDSELVILTGGGICIAGIRDFFHKKMVVNGVMNVVDFFSKDTGVVERLDDDLDGGLGHGLVDGLYDWESVGEGLGRLATGLGGSSIGLGFVKDKTCRRFIPRGTPL